MTTKDPVAWMDMVTVNLVREGINKHKARELANHFYTHQQDAYRALLELLETEGDLRFALAAGKTEIQSLRRANECYAIELADDGKQIERLTAELGDLPESQREMMAEIKRLKAELASSRVGFTKVSPYEPGNLG